MRHNYKRLWAGLAAVIIFSFAILVYFGVEIYQQAPPVPGRVLTSTGQVLFTGQDIKDGQNVWQSIGGQELGTVWGHGSYVAPDWTADWLHREATWMLNNYAMNTYGTPYDQLDNPRKAALQERLKQEIRKNTFNPQSGDLTISSERASAVKDISSFYTSLFGNDPRLDELRKDYAIPENTIKDPERQRKMNAFFFWASWACVTNRPGDNISYTNNWPSEPLVGNQPTGQVILWSVISFVLLLAGIGALAWYYAVQRRKEEEEHLLPEWDPLLALKPTASMKATLKYFWVVAALIVLQVILGVITAHYGVEGTGFYGIPIAKWLPYSVTRTWHTQLGIFWIATAWLATGLFIAPAVSGYEPKLQRAGVNFLFVCLLIIVLGSMTGQWLGVQQRLGLEVNFWFGHQGYEYVDLGRFWQIFLLIGLFLWLFLMGRAMLPAFKNVTENKHLLGLFLIASIAIALFYAAGLMWGRQTNLAIAEYWRWWVVHLWVEGFFEVFATVAIAFLFTRMGLLKVATATSAVLFSTIIFLSGGIVGTFHHLYFTGTPTAVMALGATFSALEVVPLVLIGFEGYENLTLSRAKKWIQAYKWPIYCFVAVAFWNLVGAGLFGFLINPPVALYYMQGLQTTPVHGHTALFGVYGMLGIGFMLFCLKGLTVHYAWKTRAVAFAFWAINIGLALMVLISMLPLGLIQTWASVEHGMWYARSADFTKIPILDTLRWLRVIGDTIFALGILALGYFVMGLKTGWSITKEVDAVGKEFPEGAPKGTEPASLK
ncbi:MAG: nitric-oxide reductase large subunit [Ignavibacteria bacterium]|jgi:nitric oxide reductase subunit B|nr:nitric-oxide reductase large subunit [Ignavibacteria bacterium]MCU7503406.1 nitric-oxide reductase large subunit [Ignavibacteria bacterium]MCU7516262.1 nitric-oxide reductase large subunit [Ignavibacteria bacterium]